MSDYKTALDPHIYDSPLRAAVRAAILAMPDGELAQLLAERSRLESRAAVGLHACPGCGDDTARRGLCAACKESGETPMYETAIVYDCETHDYALYLNGELVGYARSQAEGALTLDELVSELQTHTV